MNPADSASSSALLWWQTGVVYQIYPRSFKDSNGDGIGDLPGITSRLDYLAETLGVDAIWISPFYPSPMADFGYDVANYIDVDPLFGTLYDFERLLAEAHRRDLRVIIDFVPNHTSDQHPWFLESRSSRDNPRRDWYTWRDPKPDGSPPNNWIGVFGGSAWTFDEKTGQYYLHMFLPEQPDLNWRNPLVKEAMFDVLRFWLELGVDGFRVDVAHFLMKDPQLRDNPPNSSTETAYKPLGDYDSLLHIHDQGHPDIHPLFREMRSLLNSYSDSRPRMAVGEIHVFDYPLWATYYGENLDELHLPFNFGLVGVPWKADAVRNVVESVEAVMRPGTWPNYVLGNHDEHRIATRFGREAARAALMLLLTLRGTPTLYQGDEIGMIDVAIPPDQVQDPWGRRVSGLGLGRDPERTPIQWDASPVAGFCPPDARPWLPVAPDHQRFNVATECDDPRSTLTLTRTLLRLRRTSLALSSGLYRPVDAAADDCLIYLRELNGERKIIALNFANAERTVRTARGGAASVELSTHLDRRGSVDLAAFVLRSNEGLILSVSG